MGIVECLDKETGKTSVAWYAEGPHEQIVVENLEEVKKTFRDVGAGNPRLDVPEEHIPTLKDLESGIDAFTLYRMNAGTVSEEELAANGIIHRIAGGAE